ncbi:intermembrane lipid transfer protein VPS13C-like [Oncorhynchus masou masou]|uniref:intermembrane lipid transfer protein VPS13C-like n=1 Tax=Oncorhynchus masou masou TaxID=90313 RepID=UPI003183B416
MKFIFNIESSWDWSCTAMTLNRRGWVVTFHLMKASGKMFNNGSMEVSNTACTLDDMRTGHVLSADGRAPGGGGGTEDSGYLCASVEFLMAVADFFIQALPQSSAQDVPTNTKLALPGLAKTSQLPLKQLAELRDRANTDPRTGSSPRTKLRAVILDPEVVFVANLDESRRSGTGSLLPM